MHPASAARDASLAASSMCSACLMPILNYLPYSPLRLQDGVSRVCRQWAVLPLTCAHLLRGSTSRHVCPCGRVSRQARVLLRLLRKLSRRPRRPRRLIISQWRLRRHKARASTGGSLRGTSKAPTRPCSSSPTSSSTGWVCQAPSPVDAPVALSHASTCCAWILNAWQTPQFLVEIWRGPAKRFSWCPSSSGTYYPLLSSASLPFENCTLYTLTPVWETDTGASCMGLVEAHQFSRPTEAMAAAGGQHRHGDVRERVCGQGASHHPAPGPRLRRRRRARQQRACCRAAHCPQPDVPGVLLSCQWCRH